MFSTHQYFISTPLYGLLIFNHVDMLHQSSWLIPWWTSGGFHVFTFMGNNDMNGHVHIHFVWTSYFYISQMCACERNCWAIEQLNTLHFEEQPKCFPKWQPQFPFLRSVRAPFSHLLYNTACPSFWLCLSWWCWWSRTIYTNAGDTASIPESGRSPGGGHDNPFQYSFLGHPMDGGAWWAMSLGLQRIGHNWSDLGCMHPMVHEVVSYWYFSLYFLNVLLLFSGSVMSDSSRPMDCSTPGFPVHHHLLELAQTYVFWVTDAVQPSRPLSSPPPPAFSLSQHQGLF